MIFYLLVHDTPFLSAQLVSIKRYHPDAQLIALQPMGSTVQLPIKSIGASFGKTIFIIRSVLPFLSDESAVFLEWDMVLTQPLPLINAVNKEPESYNNVLYPSFLSWIKKSDLSADYLMPQISKPFVTEYTTVQQRWMTDSCGADNNFRTLDNGILHYHYFAGFKEPNKFTPERIECWNSFMDKLDLPHINDPVA